MILIEVVYKGVALRVRLCPDRGGKLVIFCTVRMDAIEFENQGFLVAS